MSATDPVSILQAWAQGGPLSQVSISDDGSQLVKEGGPAGPLTATTKVTFTHGDKTCEYTLASIFLQILDPSQGLKDYRAACKKYQVSDPVKALDKATVVGFFLGAQAEEPSADVPADYTAAASSTHHMTGDVDAGIMAEDVAVDTSATGAATQPSSESGAPSGSTSKSRDKDRRPPSSSSDKHRNRDRERQHRHDKKRSHSSSSGPSSSSALKSDEKKRKAPKTINTETLFSNLVTVVDKRSNAAQKQKREETAQLMAALSTDGFEITQELLSQYKSKTEAIMANEIPVGNSASILKAAAGKDLSRILQMYLEVIQPSSTSTSGKSASTGTNALGQKKTWRTHLVGQKPVIIVPKGMTAPITMINAHEFFGNSRFVPREVMMKKGFHKTNIPSTFSRRVGQRLGGGMVTYEIMDNPKVKLPTAKDWDRVVAVVCLGQGWQFKDWPGHYSDPVRLFSCVYGFYAGMEGAKIPAELESWAVTKAKLNRDKRGLDSVTYASFWNGLDEFMAIHKPEMLPQPEAS